MNSAHGGAGRAPTDRRSHRSAPRREGVLTLEVMVLFAALWELRNLSKGPKSHQITGATLSSDLPLGLLLGIVLLANSVVRTSADLAATAAAAYLGAARKPVVRKTVSMVHYAVLAVIVAGQTQIYLPDW